MTTPAVPVDDFEVCTRCTELRRPFVWITPKGARHRNVQECRCERDRHEERPATYGRHSFLSQVSLSGRAAADPAARSEFADRLVGFLQGAKTVSEWTEHAVRRDLADAGLDGRDAVPVLEYLDAVAGVDRKLRFEECLGFILEQSAAEVGE